MEVCIVTAMVVWIHLEITHSSLSFSVVQLWWCLQLRVSVFNFSLDLLDFFILITTMWGKIAFRHFSRSTLETKFWTSADRFSRRSLHKKILEVFASNFLECQYLSIAHFHIIPCRDECVCVCVCVCVTSRGRCCHIHPLQHVKWIDIL